FPALVMLAAFSSEKSAIKGVSRLKNKESNRGIILQKECAKANVNIELQGDKMIIEGNENFSVAQKVLFDSHNDHRIAMAMSLFSIGAKFPVRIKHPQAVEKSYPNFFEDFSKI